MNIALENQWLEEDGRGHFLSGMACLQGVMLVSECGYHFIRSFFQMNFDDQI